MNTKNRLLIAGGRRRGVGEKAASNLMTIVTVHVVYLRVAKRVYQRRQWHPTPVLLPGKSHG